MSTKSKFKFLKETEVIKGSRLYFIIIAVIYKITVKSKHLGCNIQVKLKNITSKIFKRELIIRNKIGIFLIKANDSLSKSSPYFEEYLHEWLDRDKRKGVFIDIGANIGFYSIFALNKKEFKKVIAFEANPDTYMVLKKILNLMS